MIAISANDKDNYGCPFCGCDTATLGHMYGSGTFPVMCSECKKKYVILANEVSKSTFGFGTNEKDENGETIYEFPELSEHPRKGIPSHKYVPEDVKPEYGDYCRPRGVGYDLACFVETKMAGERITAMVNEYKGQGISCRLDYRPHEPNWIQVKFSTKEKIREYFLNDKLRENDNIITKELVEEVVSMPINYTNTSKYYRGFILASWYDAKVVSEDYEDIKHGRTWSNEKIKTNPIDFYQRLGLYFVIDVIKNKDEYTNCKLLSSYVTGLDDKYSKQGKRDENSIYPINELLKLYNEEFSTSIDINKEYEYDDEHDYLSIEEDNKKIENILNKLDYSTIINLSNAFNTGEEELNKVLKDIKVEEVYPLFTLFGLLSALTKREKIVDEKDSWNWFTAKTNLGMLFHVANIKIDDNPYQEFFDIISDTVSKYKKPEEKAKQYVKE